MNLPQFRPQIERNPSEHSPRPDLRAVPVEHWTQPATRFTFGLSIFVVVAALFGLAGFHASIVTQQRSVDEANAELVELEGLHEQLRVQLTQAEAPERILAVAQETLGMVSVEPSEVTYLTAPQGEIDPATAQSLLATLPRISEAEDETGLAG